MPNRSELLIHLNRLSTVLGKAIRQGPDGSLEGKFATEHPAFTHYACAFYLAGCLSFLEGRDGSYSWNQTNASGQDFDSYVPTFPVPPRDSFAAMGINATSMDAMAQIRNAVVHHDGDLAQNRNQQSLTMVTAANLPGVTLNGSVVQLEEPFLDHVRFSALAVRRFHGEA